MALTPRLDLRQSQQLVMTPQLQQAIKLLQFTNLELTEFVATEVEKNPLLDFADGETVVSSDQSGIDSDHGSDVKGEMPRDGVVSTDEVLRSNRDVSTRDDNPLDTDFNDNVFNGDSGSDQAHSSDDTHATPMGGDQLSYNGAGSISGGGGFDENGNLESRLVEDVSLREHLNQQLKITPLNAQQKMIAAHLIELLDESGYLQESIETIPDQLGCELLEVEAVLNVLQGMEPVGVFARDLRDCLMIQLKDKDRYDPCMATLLDHLELVAQRNFAALKKTCQVDEEDLMDMLQELRDLNPKPGLAYGGGEPVQPVVPDVFVRKNPAGIWTIELNTDTLPKVLLNNSYYSELTSLAGKKEDKSYLSECYSNASWLVKALDQRAKTIMKVATELVKQQQMFFDYGVRHLRPLNLKAIAEAIEMHESTVSRVTANKYLACPRGLFEMKYFFTSAIQSADGFSSHSAESVRDQIKELIDNEDPKKILSDDKIVAMLKAEGVDIARRTVAKYREALNIPSSVQRRRIKKMGL